MVQHGRGYRAARPRAVGADMPWNGQAPYRMKLDGAAAWNGLSLDADGLIWTPATYDEPDMLFEWTLAWSQHGHSFTATFWQIQNYGSPGITFELIINDDVGSTTDTAWFWALGGLAWPASFFLHDGTPSSTFATGLFLPESHFWTPRVVPYHDEL